MNALPQFQSMSPVVETVLDRVTGSLPPVVGPRAEEAGADAAAGGFVSINPATGRRFATYRAHSSGEVAAATAAGDRAFRRWRETPMEERTAHLRSLARALAERQTELAALLTAEVGKPIAQSLREIEKCVAVCDHYADQGPAFLACEHPPGSPAQAHVEFAPLGIVLAIMPWNFPFWQLFRVAAPALVSGNVVLLKHANNVCGCARAIERVCRAAGLPRGLVQSLRISPREVETLIGDPRVRAVTVTGSAAAGKRIAAIAGAAMKPGTYELGGNDAALVLRDADIGLAAKVSAHSRLINSGQSCIATKRFIVVRSVLKRFECALVEAMAAYRVGDPMDSATQIGPLARLDRRIELQRQVAGSVAAGARLLLGGTALPGAGFFYPPTVLTDVRPGMTAFEEEVFGPVASIVPVRDEAAAIRLANATSYGLGAAVFTADRVRGRRIAAQLDCGLVFLNAYARSDLNLPFGGTKDSGYGRELGIWGARAFANVKSVWVD